MKYSLLAVKSMDETLGQIALAGFIEASWTNDLLKTWAADIDEIIITCSPVPLCIPTV
jgi:hypothetical protein